MNAITQTEARALNTAAAIPLEAADPTKNLILVPLSRLVLRPTGRNVRKTPRMSIPELAASIQRAGLLQNLIVTATADGERYEYLSMNTHADNGWSLRISSMVRDTRKRCSMSLASIRLLPAPALA